MATINELRALRYQGERAPTYKDELHYNEKYGTTLTDAQAKALDENQTAFQENVTKAKEGLTNEKEAWLKEDGNPYTTEEFKSKLDNFSTSGLMPSFDDLVNQWRQKEAIAINTFNNGKLENTFYVDPTYASAFIKEVKKPDYYNIYTDPNGKFYNISLDGYGKEIYDPLNEYTNSLYKKFGEDYDNSTKLVYNNYLNDYKTAIESGSPYVYSLSSARGQIMQTEQDNTNALTTLRIKYQEKLGNIKETIGALFNNG